VIAKIIIPIILAIVLPDLYIDQVHGRRLFRRSWWRRLMWWLPGLLMLGYAVALASIRNFIPNDIRAVNIFMFLVGLIVMPKALYVLCSGLGRWWCSVTHTHRNWGNLVALVLIALEWFVLFYGSTIGVSQLKVKRVAVYFDNLPPAFEGYRIVQFSDAHVGSFNGSKIQLLERDVDSINAQHPDLITFTGDLQNIRPQEIPPVQPILARLRARDGVVSVLGNHDYSWYIDETPAIEAANCRETIDRQRQMGWHVLLNGHTIIRRGTDSLYVAGEQNLEHPDSADFSKTMDGIPQGAFVILLQHNPKAWDRYIKASHRVSLTLSGHAHGGQISLFGLRVTRLSYPEDWGLYEDDGQMLNVSGGIGGLIPFRFGVTPEINVITLHRSRK
jgi:predicted MPP superfamily phosphohydrolase